MDKDAEHEEAVAVEPAKSSLLLLLSSHTDETMPLNAPLSQIKKKNRSETALLCTGGRHSAVRTKY